MGIFDSFFDPVTHTFLITKKLMDMADNSNPEDFSKDTEQRTNIQNQLNKSNIPEDVKQAASALPSSWKINSSQTEKKKGYTPAEVNSFDRNYSRVNKKDNYWARKISGPTEEPSEEAIKYMKENYQNQEKLI